MIRLLLIDDHALVRAGLARLIAEEGKNHGVQHWDWRHFAEKLRARTFNFSESELKPYLQLEKIIEACFAVADKLFYEPLDRYQPDQQAFFNPVRELLPDEWQIVRKGVWFNVVPRAKALALQSIGMAPVDAGERGL